MFDHQPFALVFQPEGGLRDAVAADAFLGILGELEPRLRPQVIGSTAGYGVAQGIGFDAAGIGLEYLQPLAMHGQFFRTASDTLGSLFHAVGQQVAETPAMGDFLDEGHDGLPIPPGQV